MQKTKIGISVGLFGAGIYLFGLFGGSFHIRLISDLADAVSTGLNLAERILFIGLALKALNQGTIAIPAVDNLIEKYMG